MTNLKEKLVAEHMAKARYNLARKITIWQIVAKGRLDYH